MSDEDPARNLGFLLYDAGRLLRRDIDRRTRELGLGRAQWSVLAHLARHEGIVQADLAEILDIQPITLTRQIDRLEADGLLYRCPDPNDRRVRRLYLCAAAGPILEQLRARGAKTRQRALAGFDSDERDTLMDLLARLRDNLSQASTHASTGDPSPDED